jgi:hypothetical protein
VQLTLLVTETLRGKKVVAVGAAVKKRRVVIGRATVRLNAGAQTRGTVKLNRAGRALLAHHSPLRATLVVSADGKTLATRRVTIRTVRRTR